MPAIVHSLLEGRRARIIHGAGRFEESVILEATPSGRHLRLACDPPLPNGIARWRRREAVELLEPSDAALHARIRNVVSILASGAATSAGHARPWPASAALPAWADNIIPFPVMTQVRASTGAPSPVLVFHAD